jgi:hypothetical protein
MDSIERLVYLVDLKNQVNNKRRRFFKMTVHPNIAIHDRYYAIERYELAKKEMKAMTEVISRVKKSLGARFQWNGGGMVTDIHLPDQPSINYVFFKKYINSYKAERILLGSL